MKTEDGQPATTTPAPPSQPATPAPATAQTAYTQWATTPTSQFYSPYTSHYPQAAYATHYQAYAPPVAAQPTTAGAAKQPVTSYQTSTYSLGTTSTANTATASSGAGAAAAANNAMDTSDIATLNDALGSAGVDLRAEEESLQNHSQTYHPRSYEDRTRKQPLPTQGPSFSIPHLTSVMRPIATSHKISRIPDESVTYLALCLRARLAELVEGMVKAGRHRTDEVFDRPARMYHESVSGGVPNEDGEKPIPMWSILIRSDIAKQLAALEKVEREEETRIRKERKERAEMQAAHAAALAAQANANAGASGSGLGSDPNNEMDEDAPGGSTPGGAGGTGAGGGAPKKKRKKEGPGVTARNMSEDVRKKMSNAVASQAAGLGGKYAWMNAGAGAGGAGAGAGAKKAPAAAAPTPATPAANTAPATTPAQTQVTQATPAAPTTQAGGASTTTPLSGPGSSSWARPYVPTTIRKSSISNPSSSGLSGPGSSSAYPTASSYTTGTSGGAAGVKQEEDTRTKITITMRDALFVIEKERGHGGGRGAARGWV